MRRIPVRELTRRGRSFPGKGQESPGHLLSLWLTKHRKQAVSCRELATHSGSHPLRGEGVSSTLRY